MIANRSVPTSTVIPELPYDDVPAASEWICRAFGSSLHAAHRATAPC